MLSGEIRDKFLKFFEKRGHAVIPSASLVPDKDDPSVLFTTAGMQPLIPYLMGEPHPKGKRLVNIQKCVRTQDIEEVGDNTHDTFFEMLGNWSLGDYFKEDAIKWSYELLTSKEEGFGLDPKRLYITVFAGDESIPRDIESFEIWKKVGIPEHRIYFLPDNLWSLGDDSPCGPNSEMFYDLTTEGLGDMTQDEYLAADKRQDVVEIWNDVFMDHEKRAGKIVGKLSQKNVDTGAGLERLTMALQKKNSIFDTDLFAPFLEKIQQGDTRSRRIIADHIRTATFIIAEGVIPSNTGRGYVLRRLLRRAYVHARKTSLGTEVLPTVAESVVGHESYKGLYSFSTDTGKIIREEIEKFKKALDAGLKRVDKGEDPFVLYTTYGLPLEIVEEVMDVDKERFNEQMRRHQDDSSVAGEQKFKNKL